MKALVKRIAFHVFLPLIAGLIIYIIARPDTWLVQNLLRSRYSFMDKQWEIVSAGGWAKFIVFSGPDFCWSYSMSSALLFWKYFSGITLPYFPVFVFLLILVQEFIQLLFSTAFTFDIMDIIAAVAAFFLSLLLNRKYV